MNLLPPQEKQELKLQKTQKLVIVLGNAGLIGLVCLAMVLFSLKFYMLQDARNFDSILEQMDAGRQSPDELALGDLIEKYNATLAGVDSFYKKETYVNDALEVIFGVARPDGLYLSNVLIDRDSKTDKLKIQVMGFSNTRDNLLDYKKNMESAEKIASAYFPPKSWIASKNVEFEITLEIKKP